MPVCDPIADMIIALKNAYIAKLEEVRLPGSYLKKEIARILREEGYISGYRWIDDHKQGTLLIYLLYRDKRTPAITGVKRLSKPGKRCYVRKDQIPTVMGGVGTAIVSTSKGIMTGSQAKKLGVGGELLCYIW